MTYRSQQVKTQTSCWMAGVLTLMCVAFFPIPAAFSGVPTQTVLGGSQEVVKGEIVKIDGDNYWIRKSPHKTVQLFVTADTDMVCHSEAPAHMDKVSPLSASIDMSNQSETIGFRIGDCPPSVGDTVKAEVTTLGTVTYLQPIAPEEVRSLTERLGLPQSY